MLKKGVLVAKRTLLRSFWDFKLIFSHRSRGKAKTSSVKRPVEYVILNIARNLKKKKFLNSTADFETSAEQKQEVSSSKCYRLLYML